MNISPSSIHLRKVLRDGRKALDRRHRDRERELAGNLRAGSAGCVAGGQVFGECHRIAHARHLGHDKPVEPSRQLMFEAGEGNEDLWENVLIEGWKGDVLRGQQLQKQGSWGTIVGSPDIVLSREENWDTILELKLLSATNSSISRLVEGKPDSKHLVQAATYMWMAEVPVILCYTNRADFAVEFKRKALGINKVEPQYRLFYLSFKDGQLRYRDEFDEHNVPTMVTVDGIKAYYQRLYDMRANFLLYDRPTNYSVTGEPGHWDRCDARYCPFADACNRYEHDYHTWVDAVRQVCAVSSDE